MAPFDLVSYLSEGVEHIVRDMLRAAAGNPKEIAYFLRFAAYMKRASSRRAHSEKQGVHIPPFLIASITSRCNLHCAGCYARANHACSDEEAEGQLTGAEWGGIFRQAADAGIGFVLLAGGEPMLRRDVLEAAAEVPQILFPIFTNGTLLGKETRTLLESARNLIPVLSIEGSEETTDARRGAGVYRMLTETMDSLNHSGIVFGASVTVTSRNAEETVSREFVEMLRSRGCKAVFYVEYVPADGKSPELAPDDTVRETQYAALQQRRAEFPDMVFLSFPGDEKASGGCLAAGRGFFHINANGGAEPCPFSPFSDSSLRDRPLLEILQSPLFTALQSGGMLTEYHTGGCVLFEQQAQVAALLQAAQTGDAS